MSPFAALIKTNRPREQFEVFEERAHIIEYDGKFIREKAELLAFVELRKRFPEAHVIDINPNILAQLQSTLRSVDFVLETKPAT